MARFAGVPVDVPQATTVAKPRFAGAPVEQQVTDLEPVSVRPAPQDDPYFTFPSRPGKGDDLLAWVRFKRPELAQVPDQQLAAMVRREVYPDMDPVEFYRETGFDKRFGYDTSTPDPTSGMSGGQKFLAGAGKSLVDTARGSGQLLVDSLANQAGQAGYVLDAAGLPGGNLVRTVGAPIARESAKLRREETARKAQDAPLMRTGAGLAGNITGNLVQIVGPGAALRGTTAGAALLPATVRGNAVQGAVMGAMQPVGEGDSRMGNAATGFVAGGALPGAVRGAGALKRAVGAAVRPGRSAELEAVRTIQREAASPEMGLIANPSFVPGATRTLYEETLDPGIARLETASRGTGTGWADRDSANNLARMSALREISGDDAAMAAAQDARDAATTELRNRAFAEGDAAAEAAQQARALSVGGGLAATPVARLQNQIGAMAAGQGGRSSVARSLDEVLGELRQAPPTVQGLYRVRKSINDLIEGKAGNEKSFAKAATAELMEARDLVDAELSQMAGSFPEYIGAFREMSGPINRMQVGQELLERGTSGLDPVTGELRLMPGQFTRATKDLDALAQSATGFKKAEAANILRQADTETIAAVGDDLARQASRLVRGAGGGSHTRSQQEVGKRIAVRSLARVVPGVATAVEYLESQSAQRLEKALERVLANPEEYRAIAALVSKQDRKLLEGALQRIAGTGANVSAPALTE